MIRFLSFLLVSLPLVFRSLASTVLYKTYGSLVDNYSNPISNLSLYLDYPSIDLNFTDQSDANGSFLFEFEYETLSMLSGSLMISDPLGKFESLTVEVDNYVGNNFMCDLGVLVISLENLMIDLFGSVARLRNYLPKAISGVNVSLDYYLWESDTNTTVYIGQTSNTSDTNGSFAFSQLEMLSSASYYLNLSFSRKGYVNRTISQIIIANQTAQWLGLTILRYSLAKGTVQGRLILAESESGLAGLSVQISPVNTSIFKNFSVMSSDGGFFSGQIKTIRVISKYFYVRVSVLDKNIVAKLSRSLNYSSDLGDIEIWLNKSENLIFYGRLMDNFTLNVIENATIKLIVNRTDTISGKNKSSDSGEFEVSSYIPWEGPFLAEILIKKQGYQSRMISFEGNQSSNLTTIDLGDITLDPVTRKNQTVNGTITGILFDESLNSSDFMQVLTESVCRVTVRIDNHTKIFLFTNEIINITLNKLNPNQNYTAELKIHLLNFHTAFYNISLSLNDSSFYSDFNVFSIHRKRKFYRLNVFVTLFNQTSQTNETNVRNPYVSAKLNFTPIFLTTLNKTRSRYNRSTGNPVIFTMKLLQGLEYSASLTVQTRFYQKKSVNLTLSLKNSNSSAFDLGLLRRVVFPTVAGILRDTKTMKKIKNASIALSFEEDNLSQGLIYRLRSENGTFRVRVNSTALTFFEGERYLLRACFKHKTYNSLCETKKLNWKNVYSKEFKQIFLSRKTVNISFAYKINASYMVNGTNITILMKVKNEVKQSQSFPIDLSQEGEIAVIETEKKKTAFVELVIKETREFQPWQYTKNFSSSELKKNISVKIGNIDLIRKSILVLIKVFVLGSSSKINTKKLIIITEKFSNISTIYDTFDTEKSHEKSIPIFLFLNYTISIIVAWPSNQTYEQSRDLICPSNDYCDYEMVFWANTSAIDENFLVCGSFSTTETLYGSEELNIDFEILNPINFIVTSQKRIFQPNSSIFSAIFHKIQRNSLTEKYFSMVTVRSKGFTPEFLQLSMSRSKKQKRLQNSSFFKNCSRSKNVLKLQRRMISVELKGFLSNLNESNVYYLRVKAVSSTEKGFFRPLLLLSTGEYYFRSELFMNLGYQASFLVRSLDNSMEIIKQIAFSPEIQGSRNVSAEIVSCFESNFSIFSEDAVRLRIAGKVRAGKEALPDVKVKILNLTDGSNITAAISNYRGAFYIKGFFSQNSSLLLSKPYFVSKTIGLPCEANETACLRYINAKMKRRLAGIEITSVQNNSKPHKLIKNASLTAFNGNSTIDIPVETNQTENGILSIKCSKCLTQGIQYWFSLTLQLEDPIDESNLTHILNFSMRLKKGFFRKSIHLTQVLALSRYFVLNGSLFDVTTMKNVSSNTLYYSFPSIMNNSSDWNYLMPKRVQLQPGSSRFLINLPIEEYLYCNRQVWLLLNGSLVFNDTSVLVCPGCSNILLNLTRKTISIQILGNVYDAKDSTGIENATITLFSGNDSNLTFSSSIGGYSLNLSLFSGLKNTVQFFVEKEGFRTIERTFENTVFYTNSSLALDFYMRKPVVSYKLSIFLNSNQTNQSTTLQVFILTEKIKKKTLLFNGSATVSFSLRLLFSQLTVQVFIRAVEKYQSLSSNITLGNGSTNNSRNESSITANFSLKELEIQYEKPRKAQISGIFPVKSKFFYSCSIDLERTSKTKSNGSFKVSFYVWTDQQYLCLFYFEDYSDPFPVILDPSITLNLSLGLLTPLKGLQLVQFSVKLYSCLKKIPNFNASLFVYEGSSENNIISQWFSDRQNGSVTPGKLTYQALLKRKTLYKVKLTVQTEGNLHYVTNETRFLNKNLRKVRFFVLFYDNLFRNLSFSLGAIDMSVRENANFSISVILFAGFSKTVFAFLNVSNETSFDFTFLDKNSTVFLVLSISDLKEYKINLGKLNTTAFFLNLSSVLPQISPLFRAIYPILLLSSNSNQTVLERVFLYEINSTNLVPFNTSFRNSFGVKRLSFSTPVVLEKEFSKVLLIKSRFFDEETLIISWNTTFYEIAMQRTLISGRFTSRLYDILNISAELENVTISTISNSTEIAVFNTSFDSSSQLSLAGIFKAGAELNISMIIKCRKYHNFHAHWVVQIGCENQGFEAKTSESRLIPRRVISQIEMQVTPFELTTINYTLVPFNESIFNRKFKNFSSFTITPFLNTSGYFTLSQSQVSLKKSLNPTRSPFVLILIIQNELYMKQTFLSSLSFTNDFKVSYGEVDLIALPTLNLTVTALFLDEQMTVETPVIGIHIFLEMTESETNIVTFSADSGQNSSSGLYLESFIIGSSNFSFGKTYSLSLLADKKTFVSYSTSIILVIDSFALTANFSTIYLVHNEIVGWVSGSLFDNVTKSFLSSEAVYVSFTCTETEDLEMVQVNADENGFFNVSSQVYEGFYYSAVVEATVDDFDSYTLTLYLNITNYYGVDLGLVYLSRESKTATLSGILTDSTTTLPMINFTALATSPETNTTLDSESTDTSGAFSLSWDVLAGLSSSADLSYPFVSLDPSPPEENSTEFLDLIYPLETMTNLTFNKNNKYSVSLGEIYCVRRNVTFIVTANFTGNFSENTTFLVSFNMTAASINFIFYQNVSMGINHMTGSIPTGMNYSVSISAVSDYIDFESPVIFLLNLENQFKVNLGEISLTGITVKFTVQGAVKDSTESGSIENAIVLFSISLINSSLIFENSEETDSTGDFSVTVKIPIDPTSNNESNISLIGNAVVLINKIFYESQEIDFVVDTLSLNETDATKMTFIIDIGTIYLVPTSTDGTIQGILIDPVLNAELVGESLTISIMDDTDTLVSISQMTSSKSGTFSLTTSLEKGTNYTVSIVVALDISIFESLIVELFLNVDNNYTISNIPIFGKRIQAILSFKGVLIDNSTRKTVENCLVTTSIEYSRRSECLTTSQTENCSNLSALFIDSEQLFVHVVTPQESSSNSVSFELLNSTDGSGNFIVGVRLWLGINYNISILFEKDNFLDGNYSGNVTLTEDYALNFGIITLTRRKLLGVVEGFVLDSQFLFLLKDTTIEIIATHRELPDFYLENSTVSEENGSYVVNLDGLLAGLDFLLLITANESFFQTFNQSKIRLAYSNGSTPFFLEKNLSLVRENCQFSISGNLISKLTNFSVSSAKVFLSYVFLNESSSSEETTSNIKGNFSFVLSLYQGFAYNFTVLIYPQNPYKNRSISFSEFLVSETQQQDLGEILIHTQRITSLIQGTLLDSADKIAVAGANITIRLKDSRSNCSINDPDCIIYKLKNVSSENGSFFLQKKVFMGESYQIFVRFKCKFFKIKRIHTQIFLSSTNNYLIDFGDILMRRLRVTGIVNGSAIDFVTGNGLKGGILEYTLKNQSELLFPFKKTSINSTGNFFLNFTFLQGKNYALFLVFERKYYQNLTTTIFLNLSNNYTSQLSNVVLSRKISFFDIFFRAIDNLTLLGVPKAKVFFKIQPFVGNFSLRTDESGYLNLSNLSVYQGLRYFIYYKVRHIEFLNFTAHRNLTIKSNYSISENVTMTRKNTTFYVNGSVVDEEDEPLSTVSVTLNLTLNPVLNIAGLIFTTKTDSSGEFNLNGTMPLFRAINATLKLKKSNYHTKKIRTTLKKSHNFTHSFSATLSEKTQTQSGTIEVAVSNMYENVEFQLVSYSCDLKLTYVANAEIELMEEGKVLSQTTSDENGMVTISAPLIFYGTSSSPAVYEAEIMITKQGYFEKDLEVTIGEDWAEGLNLGVVELIAEEC